LIGGAGVFGAAACSSIPEDIGLQEGRLRPCPDSPNCVNSEDQDLASSIAPLDYRGERQVAFDSLVTFLSNEPRVEVVRAEDGYIHAVFTTALMRFRDDIEFRFEEAKPLVQVRSASRLGHSDLGANRERVESIRARWKTAPLD